MVLMKSLRAGASAIVWRLLWWQLVPCKGLKTAAPVGKCLMWCTNGANVRQGPCPFPRHMAGQATTHCAFVSYPTDTPAESFTAI